MIKDNACGAPAKNFLESDDYFAWARQLTAILKKNSPSKMRGSNIFVGSDYGGDHKESPFKAYCFLVADKDLSPRWPGEIWQIKQLYLSDGRRMAFKRLNDEMRQRALAPFLNAAAQNLSGHLVVILVWKKNRFLTTGDPYAFISAFKQQGLLKATWNIHDLEKMARICQFFALIVGSLAKPSANIHWVTDDDPIVANPKHLHDTHRMAACFLSECMSSQAANVFRERRRFCFHSTAKDPWFEDLVAIPDLAAGALSKIFENWSDSGKRLENLNDTIVIDQNVPAKIRIVSDWLASNHGTLKRTMMLVRPDRAVEYKILYL